MRKHIPNILTCLNLVCGFIAIIFLFNDKMIIAVWLLIASLLFDFGDGLAARVLNAYSDLGLQLDSLADMVSFGVAPGVIMYQLILNATGVEQVADYLIYVPVIIPLFSGLRLAKFNIDRAQSEQFKGLATPGNAFFIFSLVLANHYSDSMVIENLLQSRISLVALCIVFGSLLITNIPMFSFKFRNLRFKGNELRILFVASCILLFVGTGFASLPMIIILYVIVSITWAIVT